jgi:phytoene dehydrogenase-like protein
MSINLIDDASLEAFEDSFIELKRGRLPSYFTVYANVHTNHDPSRAPAGKHTLNVWKWAPFELDQVGSAGWDNVKEVVADGIVTNLRRYIRNLTGSNILARHVASPLDHLRHTPSFQSGDVVGLDMSSGQLFGMRPTPELSQYNVPGAAGLYLCGPFMHPGGGLMGGGRPVAIRIMEQLKVNYDKVIRS